MISARPHNRSQLAAWVARQRSVRPGICQSQENNIADAFLQENPARVLAYKPSTVHQYGWIPLNPFNARNVKATVFSSSLLNIQSVILVSWAAFLHGTGCWVDDYDARAFLKIWGTVFAGTEPAPLPLLPAHHLQSDNIRNCCSCRCCIQSRHHRGVHPGSVHHTGDQQVVVHPNCTCAPATPTEQTLTPVTPFSLQRSHGRRHAADAKLVSASSDLTIMVAHSIRDAQDFKNPRVMAARKELVRLINLAHILVCISGDGANHVFAQRPIVK